MAKTSKAASLTTDVQVPAVAQETAPETVATSPSIQARPVFITITEPSHIAWAIAAVYIRAGYIVCPNSLPVVHGFTAHCTIDLRIGDPDQHAIAAADATMAHAIELQQVIDKQEDEARARLQQESQEREAQRQLVATEIAEAKKLLRRLNEKAAAI